MLDSIKEICKNKKQQKEKILIFSFINNLLIDIFNDFDISFIRFDLSEFAKLFNYKDEKRISANDIFPLLKNLKSLIDNDNFNKIIAIDVPVLEIYENNDYSLKNVLDFYSKSSADLLCFNLEYNITDLIEKLTKIKIPALVYVNSTNNNKNYLENIKNKILEAESMGALMVILNGFSASFVQKVKESVLIPVICNDRDLKCDGYYVEFSKIFGFFPMEKNEYLNLYDLIKDGINDCVNDNK